MSSAVSWSSVFDTIRPSIEEKAFMRLAVLARRGLYHRTEYLKIPSLRAKL